MSLVSDFHVLGAVIDDGIMSVSFAIKSLGERIKNRIGESSLDYKLADNLIEASDLMNPEIIQKGGMNCQQLAKLITEVDVEYKDCTPVVYDKIKKTMSEVHNTFTTVKQSIDELDAKILEGKYDLSEQLIESLSSALNDLAFSLHELFDKRTCINYGKAYERINALVNAHLVGGDLTAFPEAQEFARYARQKGYDQRDFRNPEKAERIFRDKTLNRKIKNTIRRPR